MTRFAAVVFLVFMALQTLTNGQSMPPVTPGVSRELARWRAENYSDVSYKLEIELTKGAPLMKGRVIVFVKLSDEAAENDLVLDWRTTAFQNDSDKPYVNVVSINARPGEGQWRVADEHLIINKEHLNRGRNSLIIDFASPIKTSGAAVTRYVDKEDGNEYIYTLFVPSDASTAFPVFDQPDLKARFRLQVKAPPKWKVVSNGLLNVIAKASVYEFFETPPISPYVFAFAAGDFTIFSENFSDRGLGNGTGIVKDPLQLAYVNKNRVGNFIYVRKSQAAKFKQHEAEVFRLNREGVRFLADYFDYRYPFPKYDLVLIPEFPFGGMEHAGATFLRESSIIFPSEPTKNDYISRANLIFHEAAHQWFGDTVTMKWFDDLWLKEGFAEFTAYKTLEKVMPEYNAWKAFYERNKPLAYLTDSTKGTTPIYQEIPNLSSAKSAYGNIVYRKAPAFLRQAEFFLGEEKFKTAVRAFLKKNEFANAEWKDLVGDFEKASGRGLKQWGEFWVTEPGVPIIRVRRQNDPRGKTHGFCAAQYDPFGRGRSWDLKLTALESFSDGTSLISDYGLSGSVPSKTTTTPFDRLRATGETCQERSHENRRTDFIFPNFQDYGYGIFLLDPVSREYVLKNIQNVKDDFLRSMMWGTLWDSVREGELDPRSYVDLAIGNIAIEEDESTIQAILGRVGTALNLYIDDAASSKRLPVTNSRKRKGQNQGPRTQRPTSDLISRLETVLAERMVNAKTPGQRITFYRAYLNLSSSAAAKTNLKDILAGRSKLAVFQLRTKDKFDIVTRLLTLGDADAPQLLAELEKTETSDDAKRYAYAARAAIATDENKARYFNDFMTNKEISESWIEAAFGAFNSPRHSELTLKYLKTALGELPNLKKNRKIFFVNGWLSSFIGGQKSAEALAAVKKFLEDNPNLDKDLRLKILENADNLERAVKISAKY